jgi:hypothetical protein
MRFSGEQAPDMQPVVAPASEPADVPRRNDSRRKAKYVRPPKPALTPEPSAKLRDRLIDELDGLQSADDAAGWVQRRLPDKNILTTADAKLVEHSFHVKLDAFERHPEPVSGEQSLQAPSTTQQAVERPNGTEVFADAVEEIDTTRRRLTAKTIRLRDKEHCKFVSGQPCVVCGRTPAEPSSSLCPTSCARPESQRRIHRPCLSPPSSRVASLWRRGVLVGRRQCRSRSDRSRPLETHATYPGRGLVRTRVAGQRNGRDPARPRFSLQRIHRREVRRSGSEAQ